VNAGAAWVGADGMDAGLTAAKGTEPDAAGTGTVTTAAAAPGIAAAVPTRSPSSVAAG